MKKFFAIAAMLLTSVCTFAQYESGDVTIMPKAGINIANLTNTELDSKIGFVGGVEAEYHLDNLIGISAGVLYSGQGAKKDMGVITVKESLGYINVPILCNVYVAKGLAIKAGVQPGFLVSKPGDGEGYKTVDLSVPVGASYEYNNVCLDARYNIGCTSIYKGDLENSPKNSVFQITLGYKFHL